MTAVLGMTTGWPISAAAEKVEAALARAYQGNPQLNAQRAVVRQTDEGVPQALSGYRPTISANATAGKQHIDAQGNIPGLLPGGASLPLNIKESFDTWSVGVNASQNLLNAQTPKRTRAAESQVFAARETLRVIEQSVLLSAASVYMDVLRDTANLDLQRNNIRVLQQMLKVTQDRRAAGAVTATDVDQSQAQLAAGEASLHAAISTLMTTKANYRRIIGNEPQNLLPAMPVDRFSPRTLEAATAQSLSRNPSVTAAMYDVDVAQLQVKIAEAGLYPTLVLQGSVQQQQFNSDDARLKLVNSTAQAKLTIPIYQGGSEYSAIRQNKEAVGRQNLNLDQVRDQVRANVIQYWSQLEATKAQTAAAERQGKYAESALNGVRDEAEAGQRTTLDVLNAIQALLNARVSLITAQHDRVVASYNFLSAVGGLSAAVLGLPVQVYDPSVHYHQVRDSWFGVRTPDGR
ncbi:MAG: type secretion outer membrane protein TolC family [Bradyrhizobium sp.]|nr:type secretion outer membrane protein TolC family [Bradyrhizobium sp.]